MCPKDQKVRQSAGNAETASISESCNFRRLYCYRTPVQLLSPTLGLARWTRAMRRVQRGRPWPARSYWSRGGRGLRSQRCLQAVTAARCAAVSHHTSRDCQSSGWIPADDAVAVRPVQAPGWPEARFGSLEIDTAVQLRGPLCLCAIHWSFKLSSWYCMAGGTGCRRHVGPNVPRSP